ncbi:MAG: DUF1848 domain-containing protein [Deltaproteobacteria bacterium]|nr:DUF1848 domain-containing protein [Deltaproteobacteria bacterium]
MREQTKIVLSASRRTDIPAFYMDWFMGHIESGYFSVKNPYNDRVRKVAATPEQVHTIVFWSKNFGPFIRGGYGEKLVEKGYHLFFNFTVNSQSPILEPRLPALEERLEQMRHLCRSYSPEAVVWRFDPICFFQVEGGMPADNLSDFTRIAEVAGTCGIRRCITSFLDRYSKIEKRTRAISGFSFTSPALEKQKETLLDLESRLSPLGISLYTCCEREVLESLGPDAGVLPAQCIPNDLLMDLFGGTVSLKKDSGQRIKAGCGCMVSADIGSYKEHPCPHGCLFCYANPSKAAKWPAQLSSQRRTE